MQTQTASAQHKTSTYCKSGFNLDHYPTLAALATLAFTDNTQYIFTGNIEVLSWFLESVSPRLLAVNVRTCGTSTLISMVQ